MDKFVGMGKDILQQHLSGQEQKNQDHNSSAEGAALPDEALKMAQQHAAGANAGGSDLFANVMSVIGQKQGKLQSEEIDEQDAVKQHQQAYQNDGKGDSSTLGTAAAMQALKLFTQSNHSVNSTSGQGAFLGMAMTEASKLFDDKAAQGKVQGGASKENVVQHAVETAMKMYFKSQATSQGGLAGMAAKFLG
ncbi:hypothetical protein E4U17_007641 [Claviceps sp. LM77 group G4]|nr:hypothetical protein E4U17_007641 [Claviceps sp. LM77 group G4]KAG6069942.1 hypothetical protein E4U16_007264 [Claviceps sp. LM84 group G4]